jgi:hypothetical protein
MSIASQTCFWISCAWNVIFYPLCLSLPVRPVSWRQQTVESCFLIQFASLCLLIGELKSRGICNFCDFFLVDYYLFFTFLFILGIGWFTELNMFDSFLILICSSFCEFYFSKALVIVTFFPHLCVGSL